MARRHHATMRKLDGFREKVEEFRQSNKKRIGRAAATLETAAGAWLGGAIEGRTSGATILKVPINLGIGVALFATGFFELAGEEWSGHINNLGNGFIGSYAAATGYSFGKRWKETGKMFGGGGHPWTHPYDNGWKPPAEIPPAVHGDLSEAQMANIVQRMQAAAAHG